MAHMTLFLDGDGALADWADRKLFHVKDKIRVMRLTSGMVSGQASIGIAAELPNGKAVLLELSEKLFLGAARAFEARKAIEEQLKEQPS